MKPIDLDLEKNWRILRQKKFYNNFQLDNKKWITFIIGLKSKKYRKRMVICQLVDEFGPMNSLIGKNSFLFFVGNALYLSETVIHLAMPLDSFLLLHPFSSCHCVSPGIPRKNRAGGDVAGEMPWQVTLSVISLSAG